MQTVRDDDGSHYLLLKRSSDASLVRDPQSGRTQYLENSRLTPVEGDSPLVTAATAVDPAVRRLLTATADERALGLIIELVDRGPLSVVELLESYGVCESDLHGMAGEFRAAGLLAEADATGRRGYKATPLATQAVEQLRTTTETGKRTNENDN